MARRGKEDNPVNNCPYADKCGGCAYTGCSYMEQATAKQKMMTDLLPNSDICVLLGVSPL